MMICPKCYVANDAIYTFCTECGTSLSTNPHDSSEEMVTVIKNRDELAATKIMPTPELPATKFVPPTQSPAPELPATMYIAPIKAPPPTQHYSAANTDENKPLPTQAFTPPEKAPPTTSYSDQQSSTPQFAAPTSIKVPVAPKFEEVSPKFEFQAPKTNTETVQKPKKSSKVFLIFGIFLFLLLIGGAAVYFFAQPMQANKSYVLTDSHPTQDNTLQFDNQNNTFLMVATDNSSPQKWQITPDPSDKNYYRFVNRGLGEKESLEVIDDAQDSSVTMAQSAKDVGQLWAITNVKADYYRITNQWLGDSKSLSHSKQFYYFLRIRDSGSGDGQLWKKIPAQNGQGFYLTNKQYGDTVSLQALNKDEFKDKLVMKSGEYGNRQWNLTDLGNGFYTLTAIADGKSLDVNSTQKDRIMTSAPGNSAGQRWKMTPVGNDYFRLTNESLGDNKSLEAVTFSTFQVQMVKSSDADDGQLWKITKLK